MWELINTAAEDRDLELAVLFHGEMHALAFPCRKASGGWMNALTGQRLAVDPTHWRPWQTQSTDVETKDEAGSGAASERP